MSDLCPDCVQSDVRRSIRMGSRLGGHGCDKITDGQNFAFAVGQITSRTPPSCPEEGALRIVTERWDGMRWTRRCRA